MAKERLGLIEIRVVVRAKKELRLLPCPVSCRTEKIRLHDPVFAVSELWPRIGKQDEQVRKRGAGWKRFKEETRFRVQEMKIGQFGAVAFAICARNPFTNEIDTDAKLGGMGLSIGSKKMTVTAADFPDEAGRGGKDSTKMLAEIFPAGLG